MRKILLIAILLPLLVLALQPAPAEAHPRRIQHAHTGVSSCGWQSYAYGQSNYCIWNGFHSCAWHSGYSAMFIASYVHFYTQVISTGQIWYLGSHNVYTVMSYCPTA